MGLAQESPTMVRFGVFEADFRAGELRRSGIKVRIQDLPFRALGLLLSHPNQVVTREEMRQALWPDGVFVDFDRGISSAIKRLRDTLGDSADNPLFIETVERRGYRWIGPASNVESTLAPDSRGDGVATAGVATSENAVSSSPWRPSVPLRWAVPAAILAVVVAASAVFAIFRWNSRAFRPGSVHSIAVLPLTNLSGDRSQDYLADGMTDELTTDLARISSLRVVSRTSAQQYRNSNKSLPMIASELDVDAVVEGSVRKEGDVISVNVQLIDARHDRHLWADVLRRNLGRASAMQDELTEAIAHQVGVQLTPLEQQYFSGRHPIDPSSYQAYLLGRYYWNQRTPDASPRPKAIFRMRSAAIRRTRSLSPAWPTPTWSMRCSLPTCLQMRPARRRARRRNRQSRSTMRWLRRIAPPPTFASSKIGISRVPKPSIAAPCS